MIQPAGRYSYNWTKLDDVVEWCRDLGLNVLGVLGYTPAWARTWTYHDREHLPDGRYDFCKFVSTVVKRYHHTVKHWSIWNEPNTKDHMTGSTSDFINMFGRAVGYIRSADKDAKIVAPEIATSQTNWVDWINFFKIMEEDFDIWCVHVYGKDGNTVKQYTESGRWAWYLRWLRPILDHIYPHKQSIRKVLEGTDKPIWLTETGWATNVTSEAHQKIAYEQFFKYLDGDPLYDVVTFYEIVDDPYHDDKFGIFDSRLKAKMAYIWLLGRGIEVVKEQSSEDGRTPAVTR
jgi:hypothetical protein